ncbi:MAG: VTT domain-containing protein, partial [Actinobacteria bacterium]|nr:VTT domain-containing protein [Actinomycetota bacterium]
FGRSVARPLLDRWFGFERFERLERMIERGGVTLLVGVRLIPIIPFSLIGYAAGAARVPLWRFLWTTLVGYMPITAIAVYFGTRLEGLRLTDPIVLGSVAAVLGLLALGNWIVRRQAGREAAAAVAAEQPDPVERVSGSERP